MSSSKRPLFPESLPPAKRLQSAVVHAVQRSAPTFDSLYDELILSVFSHLSSSDLCTAQAINRSWNRLAADNELWRKLYLKTFGRSRLRGSKGYSSVTRTDGREVQPLPARALSKPAVLRDWKLMFRISSNWRKGRCAIIDQLPSDPSLEAPPSSSRTHVLLAGNITIIASSQPSTSPIIYLFDQHTGKHSLTCRSQLQDDTLPSITALAIDQSPPLNSQLRLACFLSSGEFILFSIHMTQLEASSQTSLFPPSLRRAMYGQAIEAVYHHPLLVMLSQEFKIFIYDLSSGSARHTQTLSSFTSFPPTSLVLSTSSPKTYKLVIAYATQVYPAHWSVGATELIISRNMTTTSNPLSTLPLVSSPMPSSDLFCVTSTRTARALDVPQGWIDEGKLQSMREQWSRRLSRVADTQTDGKWIVLASGEGSPVATAASPYPSDRAGFSDTPTSTPLQLYRLYLPSSNSVASAGPKMTFVRTLHGQPGPISALALSDGRCVSLGINGSLWVWDLEAGSGAEVAAKSLGAQSVVVFDDRRIVTMERGKVVIRRFDI